MLARLNVRTRLFVILVPALIGLGAFAGLGIQSRIDARDDAARGLSVSRTALAASRFAGAVRTERMLTVAATVGGASSKTSAGVDEQVARTDVAAHLLEITLGELKAQDWPAANAPTASATADQLRSQINALATIRELDLSVPANARSVADAYSGVLATVADTSRAMLSGLPGATTAQTSTHWLQDGIDRESRGAAMALVAAGGDASAAQETADVLAEAGVAFDVFRRETTDAGRDALTLASAQPPVRNSDATLARLGTADQVAGADLVADRWAVEANARMTALAGVGEKLLGDEVDARAASFADAKRTMIWFAVGAFATFIIAALTALVISRTITTSLRRLGRAAREIADEQLPALVESLRGADGPPPALGFTEIDVDDHHELGAVAEALNGLARTASDVAAQQHATLRKGISDIFVNLARRNQTLLDRQIEFIDRLEANEEDPDQLENLFRLDHLATRMRRNAESLLVLAGAEAPRRRARDVALTDVIRVAVGEVEDFARIAFGEVEPVQTLGAAAVDIAHLLSELMENGTQYSPPDREVEVLGHREVDGGYRIRVIDQGVGMTDGQLDSANALLAKPPAIGLSISRSLGFVVVATLAARHGISVTIARNASGGITADVGIPRILITSADEATDAAAVGAAAKPAGANGAQPTTTPTAPTGVTHQPLAARPQPSHEPMSAPAISSDLIPDVAPAERLDDALPIGERFDEGLYSLLSGLPAVNRDEATGPVDWYRQTAEGESDEPSAPAAMAPPVAPPATSSSSAQEASSSSAQEASSSSAQEAFPSSAQEAFPSGPSFEPSSENSQGSSQGSSPAGGPSGPAGDPAAPSRPHALHRRTAQPPPVPPLPPTVPASSAPPMAAGRPPFGMPSAPPAPPTEAPADWMTPPIVSDVVAPAAETAQDSIIPLAAPDSARERVALHSIDTPPSPPPVTIDGLPVRRPGGNTATFAPMDDHAMAAPSREPGEVRSVLARYRSGLTTGRAVSKMDPETVDPASASQPHNHEES